MTKLSVQTSGSGPAVVFVHGLDSDAAVWEPVVDLLPDYLCLRVDLPGHGLSPATDDPADYERDALLSHIDEVLDQADRPVVLVGHSLGGYLGLAYAITRPSRLDAMVLVSTGPGFRSPDAREGWNEQVRSSTSDYGIPEIAAAVAFHVDSMVIDRFTELTLPMALVIGDQDKAYVGANDYMQKKLPHARRTTVEGGRHYVMKSHPEEVAAAIQDMSSAAAK